MDARQVKIKFTRDCRMIIDEIGQAIFDEIEINNTMPGDEVGLREIASLINRYLAIEIDTDNLPIDYCFPAVDLFDETKKIDPDEFARLLAEIKKISHEKLGNPVIKEVIAKIAQIGTDESVSMNVYTQNPAGMNLHTLFSKSDDLWKDEISRKFKLETEDMVKKKKTDESYGDLFKRLSGKHDEFTCYLVILQTNTGDAMTWLNEAQADAFSSGKLFRSSDEAEEFLFTNAIRGVPLCIQLSLSREEASSKIAGREPINSHIIKVNGFPVAYENRRFSFSAF